MEHSHGKDLAYISIKAKEIIEYVKAHNLEIRFSGEDPFRSDFADILKFYSMVDRLGVNRGGIANTMGSTALWWAATSNPISKMTWDVLSRTPTALSNPELRTSTPHC